MSKTYVDVVSSLVAHAYMNRDIKQPIFVKVARVSSNPIIYSVAARFPFQSRPESVIRDILGKIQWPIKIERTRDCWTILFNVYASSIGEEDINLFEEFSRTKKETPL